MLGVGVQGLGVYREGCGGSRSRVCGDARPADLGTRVCGRRGELQRSVGSLSSDRRTLQENQAGFRGAAGGVTCDGTRVASGHRGPGARGPQRHRQRAAPRPPLPSQREPVAGGRGGREARAEDSRARPARHGLSPQTRSAHAPPWPRRKNTQASAHAPLRAARARGRRPERRRSCFRERRRGPAKRRSTELVDSMKAANSGTHAC